MPTSQEAVRAAYARIAEVQRPEVWITLRTEQDALAEAARIDAAEGVFPLRGVTVAVKDNIDVAGLPTTSGLRVPTEPAALDAPAVARLRAAGAIVLGKTNLDQFATGLVGTRSPFGEVRNALWPERISGGSSSGSAVAVALGLVDISLGTDTAGSGRVPAALNRIVGIKPTLGLVPTTGMRDACRPFDTITVFAGTLAEALDATESIVGEDGKDPRARAFPATARLAAPDRPRVAVPAEGNLTSLTADARRGWDGAVTRLRAIADVDVIDIAPLLRAAKLLYEGAIVAGRYAAAGALVSEAPAAALDPTVAGIVAGAVRPLGWEYVRDSEALDRARLAALAELRGFDALLIPTAPGHPTRAEVGEDPIGVNAWMGTFTNFVNLLDLSAVAVPADVLGSESGFGVTVVGRAFEDLVIADIAAAYLGTDIDPSVASGVDLAVFGAHLRGQPLHHQLESRGARFSGNVETAPEYRLFALRTDPPKPGLVHVEEGGTRIRGELWRLPEAALGSFLAELPAPMMLGKVTLDDGREVVGFGCAASALSDAADISASGGWLAYLARD